MKMNVYHLQYSLLHQDYKYLKANTFNDQGTNPNMDRTNYNTPFLNWNASELYMEAEKGMSVYFFFFTLSQGMPNDNFSQPL